MVELNLSFNRFVKAQVLEGVLRELPALRELNLSWCTRLEALPGVVAKLKELRALNLQECSALAAMPDLSKLRSLDVQNLPAHLRPWEANGRKASAARTARAA